jgi:hypothetical protein
MCNTFSWLAKVSRFYQSEQKKRNKAGKLLKKNYSLTIVKQSRLFKLCSVVPAEIADGCRFND